MRVIFENSQFRRLWVSTVVNDAGLMIYFTVHGWLALTVTDSAFWVGATAGMSGVGLVSTSVLAGVLVDRLNRRDLIIVAQLVQATMAFTIAVLIMLDRIELWHIMVMAFVDGAVVSVKLPSRMALVLDVAGRDRLLSATAASFAAMSGMGIIVPPLAGLIVAAFDISWAYVIMGVALLVSPAILLGVRPAPASQETRASALHDLRQGVAYVFTTPAVRALILMALVGAAFGWAHETMLPVMAGKVLNVGPVGLGYLLSAGSAGGLVATLIVSNAGDVVNKRRLLVVGYAGFGLFLILFAASPLLPLSLALIAIAYAFAMVYETTLTTVLQTIVPDKMRGRVLSFQMLTWGVAGTSGFHTGAIAAAVGAPVAIAIGGGVVLLNTLGMARRLVGIQARPPQPAAGD